MLSMASRLAHLVQITGKECMSKRFTHSDTAAHQAGRVGVCRGRDQHSLHLYEEFLKGQELVLKLDVFTARDAIAK
jgi:hypothetical protein